MKLCQVAAVLKGKKTETEKFVGDINKMLQKEELFTGYNKTYYPYVEASQTQPDPRDTVPADNKDAPKNVCDLLVAAKAAWAGLIDWTYKQDAANTGAVADVKVGARVLVEKVPVTNLMFLQKQFADVRKLLENTPTLKVGMSWVYDPAVAMHRTKEPAITQRTQKVPRAFEKSKATDKFPAQVDTYFADEPVGEYKTTHYSTALSAAKKVEMLRLVGEVQEALRMALEEANLKDAKEEKVADRLLDYVFAPLTT